VLIIRPEKMSRGLGRAIFSECPLSLSLMPLRGTPHVAVLAARFRNGGGEGEGAEEVAALVPIFPRGASACSAGLNEGWVARPSLSLSLSLPTPSFRFPATRLLAGLFSGIFLALAGGWRASRPFANALSAGTGTPAARRTRPPVAATTTAQPGVAWASTRRTGRPIAAAAITTYPNRRCHCNHSSWFVASCGTTLSEASTWGAHHPIASAATAAACATTRWAPIP